MFFMFWFDVGFIGAVWSLVICVGDLVLVILC